MAEDPRTLLAIGSVIGVGIILALVALLLIFSGAVCPASCDDANPCTQDYCDENTSQCVHEPLSGEAAGCSGEAGECKRRACEEGMCVETLMEPCCGNGICEENETYESCPADCPAPPPAENCTDGLDNDLDGLIDCEDPDCECPEEPENETNATDCCDPGVECGEICGDGEDNDCDGLIDCEDPECRGTEECPIDCEDIIMINEFVDEFGRSVMDEEEGDCEDIPGEWRDKVDEVGCYAGDIPHYDCDDLESEVRYALFMDFCEEQLNADWECQTNYWGCLCDKDEPPSIEEEETEDNCGDMEDNDGDGLIDCMDPECCPPDYDQDSGVQCCCEDFFDSPDWEPHWPDCEDQLCYEGDCEERNYVWGSVCECVTGDGEVDCRSIAASGPEDCEIGVCDDPDSECRYVDYYEEPYCDCLYDCSGGESPEANANQDACELDSWCFDYDMPCYWIEGDEEIPGICVCPPKL